MESQRKHRQARPGVRTGGPTLRSLEWVGIILPIAFVTLYTYLFLRPAHDLMHEAWGIPLFIGPLAIVIALFSRWIFRAIGRVQGDLEELSRVVGHQNAQLRALNEANLALSRERLVADVLQRVVDLSRELAGARYAALSVLDESGEIKAFLTSGMDQQTRQTLGPPPSGKGLLGLMLTRTDPLRLDKLSEHGSSVGFPAGHPPMSTFLGIPIRFMEQPVGSLYLTEKIGGVPFTPADEEIVRMFANQAAVAIQNARLYEQIQALAVETERIRISREMHDGLAQVLSFVNTKAQAVETYLANGAVDEAQSQVRELGQAARNVYREVREGILALRTQVGSGRDLRESLGEYLAEFEYQLGHPVKVLWRTQSPGLGLSPLQEVQVIRIVQEALANVRKYADATQVEVEFSDEDGQLEIEVRDNGKGFNPLAIKRGEWPHLGLQTMEERAEAIGGYFEVVSSPGAGTTVRVVLPLSATPPTIGDGP